MSIVTIPLHTSELNAFNLIKDLRENKRNLHGRNLTLIRQPHLSHPRTTTLTPRLNTETDQPSEARSDGHQS